jgi:DNA polymerase-1
MVADLATAHKSLRRGHDYTIVQDIDHFEEVLAELRRANVFAFDVETTGFSYRRDKMVGLVFSVRERQAWYIPVGHYRGTQLDLDLVVEQLKPILEDPHKTKVIHNAKFDTRHVRNLGINIPVSSIEDTMLEAFVAAEGDQTFSLDDLCMRIFKVRLIKFEDLFPPRTKEKNIATVDIQIAGEYACEDGDYALRLHHRFFDKVRTQFIYKLESKLWPVVQEIEEHGAPVDREMMGIFARITAAKAAEVQRIIYDQFEAALGRRIVINISSSQQLGDVLYNQMKLPILVRTPTGAPATSELALEKLAAQYPVCRNILTYRSMLNAATRNAKELFNLIDPDTGCLHTNYLQTGATTGRFASSKPNLQNQGKKKEWKIIHVDGTVEIFTIYPREIFVAPDDYYFIENDFKAIEFIIMAQLAGEEGIVRAYLNGNDVHRQTASEMLHKPADQVTEEERDKNKTMNYLVIYGGGAGGMSMRTEMTEEEAEEALKQYFKSRPKFLLYINRVRDKARITKRVSTFFGRSQVVPEFFMAGARAAAKAERASVNRIIQGTAADMQKMGLIRASAELLKHYPRTLARMVLQTHDSQTWMVHKSIPPHIIVPIITDAMSPEVRGLPRIQVDSALGISWGSLHKYNGTDVIDIEEKIVEWRAEHSKMKATLAAGAPVNMPDAQPSLFDAQPAKAPDQPQRILFDPRRTLTKDDVPKVTELLDAFTGKNVVKIVQGDRSVTLTKHPTSLNTKTITDAFSQLFPGCTAKPDMEALAAIVDRSVVITV